MIWSLFSRFMSHLFSQLRKTFGSQKKQGMALNESFIPHPNCAVLQCTAILLFPKPLHSTQSLFYSQPWDNCFPPWQQNSWSTYLHIQSKQTFPWWGNHSEGVGVGGGCQTKPKSYLESTLRTGNGVGRTSAVRPCWWQGEKEIKWQHQEERSMVLGPKIKWNYWKFH